VGIFPKFFKIQELCELLPSLKWVSQINIEYSSQISCGFSIFLGWWKQLFHRNKTLR